MPFCSIKFKILIDFDASDQMLKFIFNQKKYLNNNIQDLHKLNQDIFQRQKVITTLLRT